MNIQYVTAEAKFNTEGKTIVSEDLLLRKMHKMATKRINF